MLAALYQSCFWHSFGVAHYDAAAGLLAHGIFGWLCKVAVVHSDSLKVLPAISQRSVSLMRRDPCMSLFHFCVHHDLAMYHRQTRVHTPQSCHVPPSDKSAYTIMLPCTTVREECIPLNQRHSQNPEAVTKLNAWPCASNDDCVDLLPELLLW